MATALIIDHSRPARLAAIQALSPLPLSWEVLEAANGEEAIDLARAAPVDVALIDIDGPDVDWIALGTDLLSINPDTRLVVVSADGEAEVVGLWKKLGGVFIAKPLNPAALAAAFSQLASDARPEA